MNTQDRANILLRHWQSLWPLPPKERGERIDALLASMPGNDNDTAAQSALAGAARSVAHTALSRFRELEKAND